MRFLDIAEVSCCEKAESQGYCPMQPGGVGLVVCVFFWLIRLELLPKCMLSLLEVRYPHAPGT